MIAIYVRCKNQNFTTEYEQIITKIVEKKFEERVFALTIASFLIYYRHNDDRK